MTADQAVQTWLLGVKLGLVVIALGWVHEGWLRRQELRQWMRRRLSR